LEPGSGVDVEPFPSIVTPVCGVTVAVALVPSPVVLVEPVSCTVKPVAGVEVELFSVAFAVLVPRSSEAEVVDNMSGDSRV